MSLQESGIFEDEDITSEGPELSSRGTQTEVPGSELLQEVQRLQELRNRIQERAALKLGSNPGSPNPNSRTPSESEDFLRERIRELESTLASHESERRAIKQREEELLDETYKLTENNHWLKAELKKYQQILSVSMEDKDTMTDVQDVLLEKKRNSYSITEEKSKWLKNQLEDNEPSITRFVVDAETMTDGCEDETDAKVKSSLCRLEKNLTGINTWPRKIKQDCQKFSSLERRKKENRCTKEFGEFFGTHVEEKRAMFEQLCWQSSKVFPATPMDVDDEDFDTRSIRSNVSACSKISRTCIGNSDLGRDEVDVSHINQKV